MAVRGRPGSAFAADAQLHVITVTLRSLRDADLLRVPTAFQILPVQVHELQAAGRAALRASPEFQRLRASIGASGPEECALPKCDRMATDP